MRAEAVVTVAVGAILIAVPAYVVYAPYGPTGETFVEITPGTGTVEIAAELHKAGVIRSAAAFEAMKEIHGGTLKAGEYRFNHPATMAEVYSRLERGDVFTITVVIPEGYNIFDVANAVQAAGLGTSADFLRAEMQHTELVKAWNPQAQSVEGFLFPDTYKFGRHATPVQMLTAMVKRFGVVARQLGLTGGTKAGPTTNHPSEPRTLAGGPDTPQDDKTLGGDDKIKNVVVMASLVEREVRVDAERPLVAGVFENRLSLGMPLQTDPAVQYASQLRGTWTGVIHQSELQSDSAYNTYTHAGLPPGPICNPGVAALKAALHPAQTDYLYFVADANGATNFSKTIAEHNEQVAEYRRKSGH